ncbi:hypothetical protein SYNPS1DRAFT_22737 [Syncephalis pseudoplumigaleata]|uniref:RGS domain-containing protein n=1 Tax=Syncephalis pseudoplumigaleata TaxID=1712513 RepID=A0A4P9YYU1_9FUNG|nr:hypothetical protein SYNPS1DRAFT_22737 [Syncephalis pseudoplumigaleata]|eukprot:RKP25277.1 hypothetical protein SYNPS1DRAFT_22737 [Syncephalis pseudoplumigaleata]
MVDAALYGATLGVWVLIVLLSLWIFYMLRQDSALEHRSVPLTIFSSIVSVSLTIFYMLRMFAAALTLVQRKSSTFARSLAARKSFGSLLHSPSLASLAQRSNSMRSRSYSGSQSIGSNGTAISGDRRRRPRSPVPPVPPLPAFLRDGTMLMPTVPEQRHIAHAHSFSSDATTIQIDNDHPRAPSHVAEPVLSPIAAETIYENSAAKGDSIGGVLEVLERDFCYRHRVWVSTRSIFKVILALTGLFLLSTSIAFGASTRMRSGIRDSTDCRFGPEFYPMHVFTLLYSLCALPAMLMIYYRTADTYGLLVELCVTAASGALLSVLQLVMSISPRVRGRVEEMQPLGNWLAFYLVAAHLLTVISPTAVVWVSTYLLRESTSEDEFINVLHRPSEFQKFCEFAISEFSVENPLFYDRCRSVMEDNHQGRRHCSAQTREELRKIYDVFLQPHAPLEVNLPYHLRNAIAAQVHEDRWSPSMFEGARWEIWRLMYRHSYPRYVRRRSTKR